MSYLKSKLNFDIQSNNKIPESEDIYQSSSWDSFFKAIDTQIFSTYSNIGKHCKSVILNGSPFQSSDSYEDVTQINPNLKSFTQCQNFVKSYNLNREVGSLYNIF